MNCENSLQIPQRGRKRHQQIHWGHVIRHNYHHVIITYGLYVEK